MMTSHKLLLSFFLFVLFIGCSSEETTTEPEPEQEVNEAMGEFIDDWTYRVFPKSPYNNIDVGEFRLWVPENHTDLKAILVLLTNFNGNSLGLASSAEWQAYAEEERLAICGVNLKSFAGTYFYDDATAGSGQALEDAIKEIATKNGIDEVASLPFLMRGYSGGGVFCYYFSIHNPERSVGFINIRGGSIYHNPANNNDIPGLMLVGQMEDDERIEILQELVLDKRNQGGPWSFAIEPNADHFYSLEESDNLAKTFFTALLKKRISDGTNELISIPEDSGWLGNLTRTNIYPYADYPGNKNSAFWLVDEDFANAWLQFQQ